MIRVRRKCGHHETEDVIREKTELVEERGLSW